MNSFLAYLQGTFNIDLGQSNKAHYAVMQSIADEFKTAADDVTMARLEMNIMTAHGYWLQCWGKMFNVKRKPGESDADYAPRIILEIVRPKNTVLAIRNKILEVLCETYPDSNFVLGDVQVVENFTLLSRYSDNAVLSGPLTSETTAAARFTSGEISYCVIDVTTPQGTMCQAIKNMVDAMVARGVQVVYH